MNLKNWRCPVCARLLFRGAIIRVQVKCPRCKSMTLLVDDEVKVETRPTVKSVVVPLRPGKERVASRA